MSDANWKISNRTGYEAAGTVMQPGFVASVSNRSGRTDVKINAEGTAPTTQDVDAARKEIVDLALKMMTDLPEQKQIADIKTNIAFAKKDLEHLEWLREELGTAKKELESFKDFSRKDAGSQMVVLGKRVDETQKEIDKLIQDDPSQIIITLKQRLSMLRGLVANTASEKVTKAAVKQVADKLLSRRVELIRRLEVAVAPILDDLASLDIAYSQTMIDAAPLTGTLPREIEAAIRQAVGVDDPAMRVNPIVTLPPKASTPVTSANPQQRYGALPAGQKSVVGVQS